MIIDSMEFPGRECGPIQDINGGHGCHNVTLYGLGFNMCQSHSPSLPHRGIHEIKRTYLASRTHGLFIT
jgi:hypothetical protein